MKSLLFFIGVIGLSACSPTQPAAIRPNILLILTDDLGYGDVGNSGNSLVQTPNLDAMADRSVRFRQFYVSSVCAPTRASLLTGRYHQRTGVRSVTNGFETMRPEEITLAEILQQNGYRTALFGKWHLGEYYPSLPNAQGFAEYLGFRTGHTDNYFDPVLEYNGKPRQLEGYITDVLTGEALHFMEKKEERPFFCYLAYNAPHTPLQVDSVWFRKYLEKGLDERTARVYGMIENLDANVGKLLQQMEKSGLARNTLVIFLSDNGPINGWRVPQEEMRYNAGLRDQKFSVYEGGIRTQCYWLWPGHWPAREITASPGAHIDILPTLLDVLKLEIPPRVDGQSLLPMLTGEKSKDQERTFFQNFALETLWEPAPAPGGIAIRDGWKVVNGKELYFLPDDPGESKDLAEVHPDTLQSLWGAYRNWWEEVHRREGGFYPRPIVIGYPQENPVFIQPHHGKATGQVRFQGWKGLLGEKKGTHPTGVDGDWLTNWHPGDAVTWQLEATAASDYEIGLNLRGRAAAGDYLFGLQVNEQEMKVPLPAFEQPAAWRRVNLVEVKLPKGEFALTLRLISRRVAGELDIESAVVQKK